MPEKDHTPNLIDDAKQLIQAAENGHLQDIITIRDQYTLDDFVQIITTESNYRTALNRAAANSHTEIVELLLKTLSKAGSNTLLAALNQTNSGYTALMLAAKNGHTDIVLLLLNALRNILQNANGVIIEAIKQQDIDGETELRKVGRNYAVIIEAINEKDTNGDTALILAAKNGHTDIVEHLLNALLDANANIIETINQQDTINLENNDGETALSCAANKGYTNIVEHLLNALRKAGTGRLLAALNHVDNNGCTALMCASKNVHTKIVKLLLNALRDANADIIETINQQDTINHENNDGETALSFAAENGHTEIVELILNALREAGTKKLLAALNHSNYDKEYTFIDTPLWAASANGHTKMVELILNTLRNANADIAEAIDQADCSGDNTLSCAAENGHTEIVELILNALREAGTKKLLAALNGSTALSWASKDGHTKMVELILNTLRDANADIAEAIDQADCFGDNALYTALENGHTEIVELILNALREAGTKKLLAALNHADNNGRTALSYASFRGHAETVKLLLAHGANLTHENTRKVASLIALNNNPPIPKDKLLAILQNHDISWVNEDYANNDQNALSTLASWGVIVGNQSFVTNMISLRQNTLHLAEHTEYLRLALQAQKLEVAKILLEHVQEHDPEHTNNRQSVLNYLLHLMVVERGSLCAINFLLAQGASPKIYISEENSTLVTHTLFRQHSAYQMGKIYRKMSSACRKKFKPETLTRQNFLARFITVVKEEKNLTSPEGINPKNICTRLQAYFNKKTLFHLAAYDNRPGVLTAIKRNIAARDDLGSEERPTKQLRR